MSHHVTSLLKTLLQLHIPLMVKFRVLRVPLPTFLSDFITYSHLPLNLLQPHSLPDIPGTHQAESHPGAFALAASSGWKALLSDGHLLPPSSLSYLCSNASFSGRLYLIITLTQNAPPHSPRPTFSASLFHALIHSILHFLLCIVCLHPVENKVSECGDFGGGLSCFVQ